MCVYVSVCVGAYVCIYVLTLTSLFLDKLNSPTQHTNMPTLAMNVLRRQLRGLAHQPPVGAHTHLIGIVKHNFDKNTHTHTHTATQYIRKHKRLITHHTHTHTTHNIRTHTHTHKSIQTKHTHLGYGNFASPPIYIYVYM